MRWKADLLTGRFPWYRVVWNLPWYLPLQFFRLGFVVTVLLYSGAAADACVMDVTA